MVAHEPNSQYPSFQAKPAQGSNRSDEIATNIINNDDDSIPAATTTEDASALLLQKLLDHLVVRVRREQLETWFRSLIVVRSDETEVELSVTSQFVRDWLAKNYLSELQAAVNAIGIGGGADSKPKKNRRLVLTFRAEDGQDSLRLVQTSPADEIERVMRKTTEARNRSFEGQPQPPQTRTSASGHNLSGHNLSGHNPVQSGPTQSGPTQPAYNQQGRQHQQPGQQQQVGQRRIGNPCRQSRAPWIETAPVRVTTDRHLRRRVEDPASHRDRRESRLDRAHAGRRAGAPQPR